MPTDFETKVKVAVYRTTAESGRPPSLEAVAEKVDAEPAAVKLAYGELRASRLLLLEEDGATIRMAPPFSGVPTQHRVTVDGVEYFANCAWDALGIPAALHCPSLVRSPAGVCFPHFGQASGLGDHRRREPRRCDAV